MSVDGDFCNVLAVDGDEPVRAGTRLERHDEALGIADPAAFDEPSRQPERSAAR